MKFTTLAATVSTASATATSVNPVEKCIELITTLQSTIIRDGENEQKAYVEYFEWCDDAHWDLSVEMKQSKSAKKKLEAGISKAESDITNADTKIQALVDQISKDEKKLKSASHERKKTRADFEASEKELAEAVDTLDRAIGVLEKEMKGGASLAQTMGGSANLQEVLMGLAVIVDAAGLAADEDKSQLTAFISSLEDADDEPGAPAAASYASHSGGITDTMDNLKDKAESQLRKEREEEMTSKHNFEMMEQALKDSLKDNKENLEDQKSEKAEADQAKADAEKALTLAQKQLAAAIKSNEDVQHDCLERAADHETSTKARTEELHAIAVAKKVIVESTGGAQKQLYESESLVQVSVHHVHLAGSRLSAQSSVKEVGAQVVNLVRRLAKQQHSSRLLQLASKVATQMMYVTSGHLRADPFKKVRGLLEDLIAKLSAEASEEAEEHAFCTKEMKETKDKKNALESDSEGLTAKIDKSASSSAKQKNEVKVLQEEIATLSKSQVILDKDRADAKAAYEIAAADIKKGLSGVQRAISMLREFYGSDGDSAAAAALLQEKDSDDDEQPTAPVNHAKSSGAGASVIGLLEVIESDMAKALTVEDTEESDAAGAYEETTTENKVTLAQKHADVKYKTQIFKSLDKAITQHAGDLEETKDQLDAVLSYDKQLQDRCVAKADQFAERKKRRDAEIAGLREALQILEGEAAFLQRHRS